MRCIQCCIQISETQHFMEVQRRIVQRHTMEHVQPGQLMKKTSCLMVCGRAATGLRQVRFADVAERISTEI